MVNYSEFKEEVEQVRLPEEGQELWLNDKELSPTMSKIIEISDDFFPLSGKERESSSDQSGVGDWSQETRMLVQSLIEAARAVGDQVRSDKMIDPSPVSKIIQHIVNHGLVEELYEYTMSDLQDKDAIPRHSVNITLISLMIGKGMDYDFKMQSVLGLSAFFSNVGMYKISDEIVNHKGKPGKGEKKIIRAHPITGYEILKKVEKRYQWLSDIAVQVHERSDGSGYPKGLIGREINPLASIIGLVDLYVELISDRPYQDKLDQTEAIKYMVKETKDFFPQKVRKVFLDQVTLFPINSYVILNNQSIGRVLRTNKKWTLRPTIELLFNSQGDKLVPPRVLKLMENPLLYIKGSVDPNVLP